MSIAQRDEFGISMAFCLASALVEALSRTCSCHLNWWYLNMLTVMVYMFFNLFPRSRSMDESLHDMY